MDHELPYFVMDGYESSKQKMKLMWLRLCFLSDEDDDYYYDDELVFFIYVVSIYQPTSTLDEVIMLCCIHWLIAVNADSCCPPVTVTIFLWIVWELANVDHS